MDGETGNVAPRIVLADGLDCFCEAVCAGAYQIKHRLARDLGRQSANDIGPRGADVADLALEVQVHDDVQTVLGSLLEVCTLIAHVLANGPLHAMSMARRGGGLMLECRNGGGS